MGNSFCQVSQEPVAKEKNSFRDVSLGKHDIMYSTITHYLSKWHRTT